MDLQKLVHDIPEVLKGGHHLHLSLFALIGLIKRPKQDLKEQISDLGDLGDNVPTTLLNSLSSRRVSLSPVR